MLADLFLRIKIFHVNGARFYALTSLRNKIFSTLLSVNISVVVVLCCSSSSICRRGFIICIVWNIATNSASVGEVTTCSMAFV